MKKLFAADLFCGAGGTSTGMAEACRELGVSVELLAINHWQVAIDTHTASHPWARHMCAAVDHINPRDVVPGGRLQILCASPECTNHSIARGGRPINDQSRATAWHVLKWCQELYIDNVLIENVREFREWGPIGANGKPLKSRKGETFRAFIEALKSLGYNVEHRILNAADYGDPTTRERLFIIGRRGGKQIHWPEQTHSPKGQETLFGKTKAYRTARKDVIDWELPNPSIFSRKKPLAPTTMARIIAGLQKFNPALEPFIVSLRGGLKNLAAPRSVDDPVPTVTASGTHLGLCEPFVITANHGDEGAASRYRRAHSVDEPLKTVTTENSFALVEPFMVNMKGKSTARDIDAPLATQTTQIHQYLCEPFLAQAGGPEGAARQPKSVDEPLSTVMTENHTAVIEPVLITVTHGKDADGRARTLDAPLPTVTSKNGIGMAEAFIVPQFGEDSPRSVDQPLGTITTTSRGVGLVESFVLPLNRTKDQPRSVEEPLRTVTATSNDMGLVEPYLVPIDQQGGGDAGTRSVDEPVPTITTKARVALAEPFITKYYGTAEANSVDAPLDTVTTKDRFGLVQPEFNGYRLDIRFRMLQPHELARAQGFPEDYKFTGTKSDIVKQIGNAVPVNLAKSLIASLLADYKGKNKAADPAFVPPKVTVMERAEVRA